MNQRQWLCTSLPIFWYICPNSTNCNVGVYQWLSSYNYPWSWWHPDPCTRGHWPLALQRVTPSPHHPTPPSLYNSVSSEDVPMGGDAWLYWVTAILGTTALALCVHDWYCCLIPAPILQHCSSCRKFNECRYKIHSTLHSCTNIRLDWNPCIRANNVDR